MLKYNLMMENGLLFYIKKTKRSIFRIFRHSGIIIQCQPRKYLVQVEQQQYWIDSDLIRPNTIIDQVEENEYPGGRIGFNDQEDLYSTIIKSTVG